MASLLLDQVLFRCGVGRGKAEAQKIIGEKFRGIGVTDDYGAYKYLFNQHQLCWAHLLKICHQAYAPAS